MLGERVAGIVMDSGKPVQARGCCFLERNAMLSEIACRLARIPTELHVESVRRRTAMQPQRVSNGPRMRSTFAISYAQSSPKIEQGKFDRLPTFHQAEGFLIDKGIHIGHLRAPLEILIKRLFGVGASHSAGQLDTGSLPFRLFTCHEVPLVSGLFLTPDRKTNVPVRNRKADGRYQCYERVNRLSFSRITHQ